MYRASIQKHARTRHLARRDASPGSQSMYPSLLVRGSVKKSTLASQSLPIPDDMATDEDAIINTNVSANSVIDALHDGQIGNLSDASTSTEIDSDAATNHSDAMHKLPSNTTLSDYPEMLSDTSTSAVYDADAESESDVSCVAFKVVDGLWDEGRGFWVHDFALVRKFEEEKRMADITGGGEECFTAEMEKDDEDVSEAMRAWINSRFPDEQEENLEEDEED
ncbi:uncharacterized protein EAE97_008119 [Botrytis byssoidea]|uniref:Uncharacterized protein n=1 Tax=Botrytis byssoidea TaxID=139641 RepID=A0A9P5I926_9HELO|nr:uncharacterized protein EAE97_008119 [Botrytis byssoidea]KAF7935212.1 hypothetical protein EAE97_008119 [Botrytis byssoidea]